MCLQLRDCLEPEVYDLFHKKLTEHALMKDPKFLWCCHVSSSMRLVPPCRSIGSRSDFLPGCNLDNELFVLAVQTVF